MAPLASALPSWGKGPGAGRAENTDLKGSSNLGSDPAPNRAVTATEQSGRPASHPVQALVSPGPATPRTKEEPPANPDLHPRHIQPFHQRHWARAVCTGKHSPMIACWRLQQGTVSAESRGAGQAKQNERAGERV